MYDSRTSVTNCLKLSPSSLDDPITCRLSGLVQRLRLEIDTRLTDAGLSGSTPHSLKVSSLSDPRLGTVLETTSCTHIPLSMESADRVVWDGMAAMYRTLPNAPLKASSVSAGATWCLPTNHTMCMDRKLHSSRTVSTRAMW